MTVRVGINGFGRIGRNYLRAALAIGADVEVVAVNDLTSAETLAHLLRYDSTHGRLSVPRSRWSRAPILLVGDRITGAGRAGARRPLPWGELGVDVVIESTGLFTTRATAAAHLEAGAKRVIISAPSADADATFVIGVNDHEFDPDKRRRGLQRLVHHQLLRAHGQGARRRLRHRERADDHRARLHQRPEPARPAPQGPAPGPGRRRSTSCPASTGAARATGLVLPSMKGRLDGTALRVPVPAGSITDFTAVVPGRSDGRRGQRGLRRGGGQAAARPRCSSTPRTPSSPRDIVGQPGLVHLRRRADHGHAVSDGDLPGQGPGVVRQRVGLRQPPGRPDRPGRRRAA